MINVLIVFSLSAMPQADVSVITMLQLQINRYKRENDKPKCLLRSQKTNTFLWNTLKI